jgi:hypothetical protein
LLRRCDVAAEEDLNRFDVAVCDGLPVRFFDANAAFRPGFTVRVLEAFADFAALGCRDAGLGDFLRDFLDIRLPFVAFGGSIIGVLQTLTGVPDSSRWLGKSDGLGVWLQGIRHTACPLVE